MSLSILSLPIAFAGGVLGLLSPCVWPLIPIVMSSASQQGFKAQLYFALGLSTAFTLAGTLLTYLLLALGLGVQSYRILAALLLMMVALVLLLPQLSQHLTLLLQRIMAPFQQLQNQWQGRSQFILGLLLGLVWLPCVGPTLGAAIALAAMGENVAMASLTLFMFGLGSALALLVVGRLSKLLLQKVNGNLFKNAQRMKQILAVLLLLLGLMTLTGADKVMERYAIQFLPDWAIGL